jgi:hypothetical protein
VIPIRFEALLPFARTTCRWLPAIERTRCKVVPGIPVMPAFLVPDDFRAFMRSVVADLDAHHGRLVDAEDAFQDACGYGGRIDGGTYRFHYLTRDGAHRWVTVLAEEEIRAIADGLQIEARGERTALVRTHARPASGHPLVIWGDHNDDALSVRTLDHLIAALEILWLSAREQPRIVRIWSTRDDQLVAAISRDQCALYVIESTDGYATSTGDSQRTDSFEARDHDGNPLVVPWADCVPWPIACRALVRFAAHGDLGPEITVEGRIPSQLLVHGDHDRQAVTEPRREPASDPSRTSLPRLAPPPVPTAVTDTSDITSPVERDRDP